MKLYFTPGACSLAAHIVLHELDLPFTACKVDLKAKTTAQGDDYTQINPKGYVPALQLDEGAVLTENPAILQYVAELKPAAALVPTAGTLAHYRLQEWLGFINSEVHKGFSPLFAPDIPEQTKRSTIAKLGKRFDYLQGVLAKQDYLLGERFSVADAYLYTVLSWAHPLGVELNHWPALVAFHARVEARPSVKAARAMEAK